MSKNLILSPTTAADIDSKVERVIKGLGNPEPPLRLADVRELLKLDLAFYTAEDPGLAREVVSRIRVATIQVFQRPTLLMDAIKKWSLKALYMPDSKRILLDANLPLLKHRWNEAHEVGHSLLPWHDDLMHGDNEHTVSRECREHIETEANFAAGRLLFLRDHFTDEARSLSPRFDSVKLLHTRYGNTMSTTLHRFVEAVGDETPVLGILSCHPHRLPADFDPKKPTRYFIQSRAFHERFSRIAEVDVFREMKTYCANKSGGRLGEAEMILDDDRGERHRFYFETFFNTFDALTLGIYLQPGQVIVPVSVGNSRGRRRR